jgi:hypothetical protein
LRIPKAKGKNVRLFIFKSDTTNLVGHELTVDTPLFESLRSGTVLSVSVGEDFIHASGHRKVAAAVAATDESAMGTFKPPRWFDLGPNATPVPKMGKKVKPIIVITIIVTIIIILVIDIVVVLTALVIIIVLTIIIAIIVEGQPEGRKSRRAGVERPADRVWGSLQEKTGRNAGEGTHTHTHVYMCTRTCT